MRRRNNFIKTIIFWIVVLLILYFIFSGKLSQTYNDLKNSIKSSQAEKSLEDNPNIVKEIQGNGCYISETMYPNYADTIKENLCRESVCILKNFYYNSYKCDGKDLVCYCQKNK